VAALFERIRIITYPAVRRVRCRGVVFAVEHFGKVTFYKSAITASVSRRGFGRVPPKVHHLNVARVFNAEGLAFVTVTANVVWGFGAGRFAHDLFGAFVYFFVCLRFVHRVVKYFVCAHFV
jgi:hypothetical protein